MNEILDNLINSLLVQFFTLPMLLLCLIISGIVWAHRMVLETAWPKIKEQKLWSDAWLPISPMIIGGLLGWLLPKSYPMPDHFLLVSERVFCAVLCGMVSSTVYRIFKKFGTDKLVAIITALVAGAVKSDTDQKL